ncbi:ubiquitin-related modifier 1 [Dentipellis sp. KUC8613]|nr:ubiquitin-related modifier 1 [Dentipellis sp. KUC8613]
MSTTINLKIEFGGGLELLFNNQRSHRVSIPAHTSTAVSAAPGTDAGEGVELKQKPADLNFLIHWLRDNLLTERAELFVDEGTGSVRPGILVLVNDTDWELEGEGAYEVQEGDEVVFISTLHGG